MSALLFLDTETTGLSLDDDIWEFAAIKRYDDGFEESWHHFVKHSRHKCRALPESFADDHRRRYSESSAILPEDLAELVENLTEDRPHIVGAVPNFDTERLTRLLEAHRRKPGWHYHLIDVENLAVGYLAGRAEHEGWTPIPLPWDSDTLSQMCGVEPPTDERHTAMGDALWARALYDAITGQPRAVVNRTEQADA